MKPRVSRVVSVIKAYGPAAFIAIALIGIVAFSSTRYGEHIQNVSSDCLPGYQEIYFGPGAYACQRGKDPLSN